MKKSRLAYFLNLFCLPLFVITICGCANNDVNNQERHIATLMPCNDINRSILLSIYPYCPDAKLAIGFPICILIENKSDDSIKFPTDFGIKIYQYQENEAQWSEVENQMSYHGDGIVLFSQGDGDWSYLDTVKPKLPYSETPVKVRIVVSGNSLQYNEPIGAYLDVMLEP